MARSLLASLGTAMGRRSHLKRVDLERRVVAHVWRRCLAILALAARAHNRLAGRRCDGRLPLRIVADWARRPEARNPVGDAIALVCTDVDEDHLPAVE
tara:strand:+ start:815 stop:1108 length:294 start_codon:yes stop_codon:yes gene_type:complete